MITLVNCFPPAFPCELENTEVFVFCYYRLFCHDANTLSRMGLCLIDRVSRVRRKLGNHFYQRFAETRDYGMFNRRGAVVFIGCLRAASYRHFLGVLE